MKGAFPLLIAAAVLLFGQAANKKATPPAAKPDTWQKSKECATQAEKVIADWPQHTLGTKPDDWSNHYSPKYDRCFIWAYFSHVSKDEKVFPTTFVTTLWDAFERSRLASSCTVLTQIDCAEQIRRTYRDQDLDDVSKKPNGKPFAEASAVEQEAVRKVVDRIKEPEALSSQLCNIDGKPEECAKAANFISEHMKN